MVCMHFIPLEHILLLFPWLFQDQLQSDRSHSFECRNVYTTFPEIRVRNRKIWFLKVCERARLHSWILSAFHKNQECLLKIISDSKNFFDSHIKTKVLSYCNGTKYFLSFAKQISQNFWGSTFRPFFTDNEIATTSRGKPNYLSNCSPIFQS